MRKKILAVIFTLCLAVVTMTVMAFADTPESVTIGEYTLMDGASLLSNGGVATYSDGVLYLDNFTFSNGSASRAVYSTGDLTIEFSGNNSISADMYGIHVENGGSLSVVGSADATLEITARDAILDNGGNVSIAGGNVVINVTNYAIYAANGGNLTISDCTLIANSGSIVTEFTGAITISDSTINTVVGSAIVSSGGSVYINGNVDITSGSGISAPSGVIYITPTSGSSLAIQAGTTTIYCSTTTTISSTSETVTIKAHTHTTEIQNVKDATCGEDGYTGDEVCTVCGETITTGTVIAATGHTTEIRNAKDATCTEDGYTGDEVCTVCGETITAGEVIPATGHTLTHYEAVEATCTTDGNIEYWYCSVCGKYFSDEDCTTEITLEDTVVAATDNHTYKAIVTDPTCTEKGYTTYICTECGDNYRDDYTDPVGHTAGTPVKENYVPVTATKDGYYELATYCTVCGEEISRSYTTIAAYGTNVRETIDWAAVLNAHANKTTTTVTIEEITITEPVESTDTETEVDSGDEVESEPAVEAEAPAETNPTTGMVMALMPMAMAALAAVSSKRR